MHVTSTKTRVDNGDIIEFQLARADIGNGRTAYFVRMGINDRLVLQVEYDNLDDARRDFWAR